MNGELFQNMAPNAKRSFVVTVALSAIATVLERFRSISVLYCLS